MDDNIQDWMDWVTGLTGADEGDPLLTHAEITDIVDGVVATLGTLHFDPSTLPATATSRPRGGFSDPNDLIHYLEGGGLLAHAEDGSFLPLPIVHVLKTTRGGSPDIIYEVWIDDET